MGERKKIRKATARQAAISSRDVSRMHLWNVAARASTDGSAMDALVLENHVLLREEQPEWREGEDWRKTFTLD